MWELLTTEVVETNEVNLSEKKGGKKNKILRIEILYTFVKKEQPRKVLVKENSERK